MITGATRVAGVIGDPVDHSLSPAIHNAAFEARGLDWVYVAFPVPAGRGQAAVSAMGDLGIHGLNVTIPHKLDAARACQELSATAQRLGSVNTVVRRPDGSLFGDSTDGEGFLRSLRDEGVEPGGRAVLVLGAGGAARAVAGALTGAGAGVTVWARRPEAAEETARLAGAHAHEGGGDATRLVSGADIVVNATPLGMGGEEPPFDPAALTAGHTVADLIYVPAATPLLGWAARQGARTVPGLGMLVHQAALAFELWTGQDAPVQTMRKAAERALDA